MKKGARYAVAVMVCVAIFFLWVMFQTYVAKGILIGFLFCSAMVVAWKAIVRGGKKTDQRQPSKESPATTEKSREDDKTDEQQNKQTTKLFDGSKKNNTQQDDIMSTLQSKIVPGGQEELTRIVDELMDVTDHRCRRDILRRIYLYQSTLFTIADDKSKARIVGGTLMRKDFGVDEKLATQVYDYILKRFATENYGFADNQLLEMLSASFGNVPMNCTGDVINGASGLYGRCATNPIPVRGIPQSERYLSHLRTPEGGKVTWKRIGSLDSEISDHPIDLYYIHDEAGNEVGQVYISAYQAITSHTAPNGFTYQEESDSSCVSHS